MSTPQPEFAIQRIYLKDLSFEAPNSPAIFTQKWEPIVNFNLSTEHAYLEDNLYEVTLNLVTSVKTQDETAFIVEVKQAGTFVIKGVDGQALDHILHSFCPNILFPYAREIVSSEVVRGGFPQLTLAPVNFDAVYAQRRQNQTSSETEKA